jgi:class 3 adenylate cyclase/tetratricopeptide (TPR) repeat protein
MGSYRAAKIVFRDRFTNERPFAREFAGLQKFEPISRTHPGFAAILHVGRHASESYFYSVMELADDTVDGAAWRGGRYSPRTLSHDLATRGRLPPEECVQIMQPLSEALGHLHEHGLVHRDLKPSNVIFVGGTPRLTDIGLVTTIGEPATAVGTVGYMAPEGPGTPAADLYGLGMVLYQMVTGKSLGDYPDLPTDLPATGSALDLRQLNEVILRATERDPSLRFQSAREFGRVLELCRCTLQRSGEGVTAVRPTKRLRQNLSEGERKQVTALALDVCWKQEVDPEDARTVLQEFRELQEREIGHYGGSVNQSLGNGLVAVFGAPTAFEDHARRAVYAALALRSLADHTQPIVARGVDFEIRCGVDTGLAVLAETSAAPAEITGNPFQTAARLCHIAAPGQVLMSEETWKMLRGEFGTRCLGSPSVPGLAEPMAVYELSALMHRSSLEGAGKRLSPFVGRNTELSLLRDRFAEAAQGRGQVVFLAGEPGMGKSRLLLEFRRSLEGRALTWLTGRSVSFGRETALLPVIEIVNQLLQIEPGHDTEADRRKVDAVERAIPAELAWTRPYLKFLLGLATERDEVAHLDARHRKTKTFEALRALLWERARRQPVVLAMEDLHWMDRVSEEFVTCISESLGMAPILLVATHRPGYQNLFPERSYATRSTLGRLSQMDSLRIAQDMLGTVVCPNELQNLIQAKAEGNPFFVEELVKALIDLGALQVEQGRYTMKQRLLTVVPDTVQNVLMSRIDRLPAPAKKTLQLASVIGREFQLALLEAISDLRDPLGDSLQHLKNAELIYERGLLPDPACVFKHALTQEVAYSSLLLQRRKELHRLVAASIEELYTARLPDFYGSLAYHYQLGEEWQRALDYLLRAADRAQSIGGFREQAGLLTQAIAVAERLGQTERIPELRANRGIAYSRAGLWADARPELEFALAEIPSDHAERRAEVLLELAGVCFWSLDVPGMVQHATRGYALAERVGRNDLVAGMMAWVAAAEQANGNLGAAAEGFERALERGSGFRYASLSVYPLTLYLSGRISDAIARGRQVAQMCARLGDNLVTTFNNPHLGVALAASGRYDEAIRLFDETLALGSLHELWAFHARTMALSAGLHLDVYNYPGHEAIAEEARERGCIVGWQPPVVSAGLDLIFNYARQFDVPRAEQLLLEAAEVVQSTGGWHRWLWELRLAQARAEVASAREDWAAARRLATESIAQSRSRGRVKYHVAGLITRARALAACGRKKAALADLRSALELARPVGDPAMLLRACRPLLVLEGNDDLGREAQSAAQNIYHALPTELMRQRFLVGAGATIIDRGFVRLSASA